jgi:HD-like signal output (HDOD) protein
MLIAKYSADATTPLTTLIKPNAYRELPMSKLAEKVQKELIQAIDNDELVLPTLPEVALKVREAAEDPDISIPQLSKVIGNDAALTARIIKVVNSPLLRTNKEITDLQMAVSRLGINYTCNLATGLAMEQMLQATSDVVDRKMREVWNKSTEIAGICHVLCKHYTRLLPDQATLAGLVHQIGVLPILTYAEEHSELLADSISLNHVIEQIHPIIGDKILRTWEFPELISMVPGQYLDFTRDSAKVDYVDIVQVATLQSFVGSEHPYTQLDWSQIPAFRKLGLDPSQNLNDDEDLSAAMEAAMGMLQ